MLNYKKPAFWIILVSVAVCIAAAVCFLTDPISQNTLPDKAGSSESYTVATTVFTTNPEDMMAHPQFYVPASFLARLTRTADGYALQFYKTDVQAWIYAEELTPIELTQENWDARFTQYFNYSSSEYFPIQDVNYETLRKDNRRAWQGSLGSDDRAASFVYTLLEQKNGDLYLVTNDDPCVGSGDPEGPLCPWLMHRLYATDHKANLVDSYWAEFSPGYDLPSGEVRFPEASTINGIHLPTLLLSKTDDRFILRIPALDLPSYEGSYIRTADSVTLSSDSGETFVFRLIARTDYSGYMLEFDASSSDELRGFERKTNEYSTTVINEFIMPDGMCYY